MHNFCERASARACDLQFNWAVRRIHADSSSAAHDTAARVAAQNHHVVNMRAVVVVAQKNW